MIEKFNSIRRTNARSYSDLEILDMEPSDIQTSLIYRRLHLIRSRIKLPRSTDDFMCLMGIFRGRALSGGEGHRRETKHDAIPFQNRFHTKWWWTIRIIGWCSMNLYIVCFMFRVCTFLRTTIKIKLAFMTRDT
ncbi:hypothetical protein YC2023_070897 [Brassica napus]